MYKTMCKISVHWLDLYLYAHGVYFSVRY